MQAGVAIFISDKADFKPKLVRKDKVGHYILIKGKFHQEVIMITSIHAPTFGVPNFIKQILLGTKNRQVQIQS
jgi:hypothetical protein